MTQLVTFQKVQLITVALKADGPIPKATLEYWANEGWLGKSPLDSGEIDPALISYNDRGRWVVVTTHEPARRGRPPKART